MKTTLLHLAFQAGIWLCVQPTSVCAQQVVDSLYRPVIHAPAYPRQSGPTVFVDRFHGNYHTVEGLYKPFADLLQADGYKVISSDHRFSGDYLKACKMLVIVNALHPTNENNWTLPTPSAFTTQEIAELNRWVKEGGSLFLIADHMPFAGAAHDLAASFGFEFYNGFAIAPGGIDFFDQKSGLRQCALSRGRHPHEHVTEVMAFAGQAFQVPQHGVPVIVLDSTYQLHLPHTAWEFNQNSTSIPAVGLALGAYQFYGQGRVVVFGEAAMFTAQRQGIFQVGMNYSGAAQNAQLLLNIIHWLDHLFK